MMNCPYCGKLTDPKLESCPHCGGPMHIKTPQAADPRRPQHHCPRCKAAVQDGDIICVRCGTNLLTGEKIAVEQAAEVAVAGTRSWLWIAVSVVLLALITVGVGGAYLYLSKDPVGEALRLNRMGNTLEAVNNLQLYVEKHPSKTEAQLVLGKLRYQQGQDFAKAAQSFAEVAQRDPANQDAAYMEVVAASRIQGEAGRSRVIDALNRMVERNPEDERARYLLSIALGANRDFAGEIKHLEVIIQSGDAGSEEDRALGIAQALSGDSAAAAQTLAAALKNEASDGNTAAALGLVSSLTGNVDEAARYLQQSLENNTTIENAARTRLGMLYLQQGDIDKALPLFRDARTAAQPDPAAQFFYAVCLQASTLNTEALVEYERILAEKSAFAADAATMAAMIYMEQDTLQRARDAVAKAIQIGGPSAERYTIEGRIHLLDGEETEAQTSFRNATRADPEYPAAHLENGLLYVSRGVLPEGLKELERYLELIADKGAASNGPEVELLVNQLKQTIDRGAGGASQAEEQ